MTIVLDPVSGELTVDVTGPLAGKAGALSLLTAATSLVEQQAPETPWPAVPPPIPPPIPPQRPAG